MGHALSTNATTFKAYPPPSRKSADTRHIHDLPFELLQEILVCAAFLVDEHRAGSFMGQRYDELDDERSQLHAVWNWLDVMAVCQLWRTAANESPWFHSRLALQNTTTMRRSGRANFLCTS